MDRFIAGWLSGLGGGILMNIWSFFSFHVLNLTKYRLIDWTGALVYGKLPDTVLEAVVALLVNLLFAGFLGGVFAMIIMILGSDQFILKGIIISTIFAFIFLTLPSLFQEPILRKLEVESVISNYIEAIIWGLSVPTILQRIDITKSIKA